MRTSRPERQPWYHQHDTRRFVSSSSCTLTKKMGTRQRKKFVDFMPLETKAIEFLEGAGEEFGVSALENCYTDKKQPHDLGYVLKIVRRFIAAGLPIAHCLLIEKFCRQPKISLSVRGYEGPRKRLLQKKKRCHRDSPQN
ncbi:unnamed protein product, partial [Nesidiocoris tenuis]